VIDVAEYQPGQPLDDLAAVARLARGEVAECDLPTAGRVLVARWVDYPDEHPAQVQYTVVDRGEFLVYSERYDGLSTDDAGGLAHWYEPVPAEEKP
jgi:uncharacterized protein YndB with AHSA1/START domain